LLRFHTISGYKAFGPRSFWTTPFSPKGPRFRMKLDIENLENFLANADGRPQWAAFARGFAFVRKYEKDLRKQVEEQLAQNRLADKPIILHGQTGTGKTVALGHLAFVTRRSLKHPVLFIERKLQRPLPSRYRPLLQMAEDNGCSSFPRYLGWDGQSEDYNRLSELPERGKLEHRVLCPFAERSISAGNGLCNFRSINRTGCLRLRLVTKARCPKSNCLSCSCLAVKDDRFISQSICASCSSTCFLRSSRTCARRRSLVQKPPIEVFHLRLLESF